MLAAACDRVRVSDRGAALIANSLLQDTGIVSNQDTSDIVDRNKVRRARQKKRLSFQNDKESVKVRGIYFDGRKDQTVISKRIGSKCYQKMVREENMTLVEEPGSKFIGHYSVKSGSADGISNGIF